MKTTNQAKTLQSKTFARILRNHQGRVLTCTAVLLCGLAASISAKAAPTVINETPERGFTIPINQQTPVVVKTSPDAECDLSAQGGDESKKLRLYANIDGYVRFHVKARQESDEQRLQLDCKAKGLVTRYPIHLLAGSSPTAEMPFPTSEAPLPKGSTVRLGLSEAEAQLLSDDDLLQRGYPQRPEASDAPESYAKWLEQMSRPMAMIPAHSVSRTDISAAPATKKSSNWSGLEAHRTVTHTWDTVQGEWAIPDLVIGESGTTTYSATWVGLDGDGLKDLVQAGSEQDDTDFIFQITSYTAWTELLPNQPTEQVAGLSINPGDDFAVYVYIGNSTGKRDIKGGYAWFSLNDYTSGVGTVISTPLAGTFVNGTEAEWIMERPKVGGSLPDLSEYITLIMTNSYAHKAGGKLIPCGTAANRDIDMYNGSDLLSAAIWNGTGSNFVTFLWTNFH